MVSSTIEEEKKDLQDFIEGEITQFNTEINMYALIHNNKLFYQNASEKCISSYIKLWAETNKAKRKSESKINKDLSKEALIEKLYETHSSLPDNMFDTLRNIEFKDTKILGDDYVIVNDYNNLIITYICHYKNKDAKSPAWSVISELFNKNRNGLEKYFKYKDDDNKRNEYIKELDDFLREYEE